MKTSTKLIIAGAIAGTGMVAAIFSARQYINKGDKSAKIIGGADGPTSIFLAGNIQDDTNGQGEYVGQDKEVIGYYKRVGIAKVDETYEEMLTLRDEEKKGYLVANDDGTAYFELDGEITKYTFDKKNFYLSDNAEKSEGFPYTYIGGRLIISDATTVTQYLRLTDEELAAYLENTK